jgi:YesN/AraC family two-component response regulator
MKMRVMFVDDEPAILSGLRNLLYKERHRWEMTFFDAAEVALEAQRMQPYDVVISDMRMPGMDGATLLIAVMNEFPSTRRILLSGYSDPEALARVAPALDELLTKPCDLTTLRAAIENAARKTDES